MCENFADNSGISKPEHRKDLPFELEKKLQIQHESCGWTLYTERAHVENIFYSRFNYFMLFFTLFVSVIVAIYVSDDINYTGWIMFFLSLWGFIILLCLRRTLIKTYKFLECILKWLDSMSQNYVSPMIRMRFGPRKYEKMNYKSTNYMLAYIIPMVCIIFMGIACVFSVFLIYNEELAQTSKIIYDAIQVIN